jgi:hypothetical protein
MTYLLSGTTSLCPTCLKTIPASKIEENGSIYLQKACPEHGNFKTLIWRQIRPTTPIGQIAVSGVLEQSAIMLL